MFTEICLSEASLVKKSLQSSSLTKRFWPLSVFWLFPIGVIRVFCKQSFLMIALSVSTMHTAPSSLLSKPAA